MNARNPSARASGVSGAFSSGIGGGTGVARAEACKSVVIAYFQRSHADAQTVDPNRESGPLDQLAFGRVLADYRTRVVDVRVDAVPAGTRREVHQTAIAPRARKVVPLPGGPLAACAGDQV